MRPASIPSLPRSRLALARARTRLLVIPGWFARFACIVWCALVSFGCASASQARLTLRAPAPSAPAAVAEASPAAAASSNLALIMEIELDAVRALIEVELPRTQNQDWIKVTHGDDSPRIELRYFVERDPVELTFENGVLRTKVPIRYWADVRGAVKSPLPWQDDWFDLDADQSWGTRQAPQRVTLVVNSKAELDAQSNLRMQSVMDPLEPGPVPAGSFCVDAGIHICVSKDSFAGEVRSAFKERIEPALRAAVAELDRGLERRAQLRTELSRWWQQLQCPWALHRGFTPACEPNPSEQGLWLQVLPERLAKTELWAEATRLRILVSVDAKLQLTQGAPPASAVRPLPTMEQLLTIDTGATLHVRVALPYELLTSQLALSLPSAELSMGRIGKAKLAGARVIGASTDAAQSRLLLELRFAGDVDAVLYVYAQPTPVAGGIALLQLEYTEASQRMFAAALPDVDHAALRLALERALRIDLEPAAVLVVRSATKALARNATTLAPSVEGFHMAFSDLRLGNQSLLALLTLTGQLSVRIRP